MFLALKNWAESLKRNLYALYLAYHHAGVPLSAKIIAAMVVAYALSPIDLIPDFIPVIGYLDDMILLPLGIALGVCRINLIEAKDSGFEAYFWLF